MHKERFSTYLGLGGLTTLATGLTLMSAGSTGPTNLATALAAVGAIALIGVGALNARAILAFSRTRKARVGTNALLMTVFFTAILVIVQAISVRNGQQFDFTRNQRFTLAPQTLSVLDALNANVSITGFFRRASGQRQVAIDLLDLYARRNPRLSYEIVDPDRRPHIADEMNATYNDIVIASGDRTRTVDEITEERLTNALAQATRPALKTIYFSSGHGERGINSDGRTGYATVRESLANQGYHVLEIPLLDVQEIPPDCEVLVVADPFKRYLQSETQLIDAFLRRGGSVLFLIEPWVDLPNIISLLEDHGLSLPPAEILEEVTVRDSDREFGPRWTKVLRYQPHIITRDFRTATFYHSARPVQIVADESDLRFKTSYLAISSESAWGEVNEESFKSGSATRDGRDLAGPLPLAAVVERNYTTIPGDSAPTSRIVLFGDADFAANSTYGLLGNSDLFHNVIAYLAGDEDLISIRPRARARDQVYITAAQGRMIFALCVILLPLSVVVVGTTVFVKRRKN